MKKTNKQLHSKRFGDLKGKIDPISPYPIEDAIKLAKETSTTKFDASIDIVIRTGIDPKKSDQQIRTTASLPHGTGKKLIIAVIVPEDKQKEAKDAGAKIVGGEELIEKIAKTGKINFDILLTIPEMMRSLSKIAKILGPKGIMPNPKTETLTTNIKKSVEELAKGKIRYKTDDTGNIHTAIGKASFDDKKLLENYNTFLDSVNEQKPTAIKGSFIKNISISSSMGPGIKVQVQ